jgi:hypothetical protein
MRRLAAGAVLAGVLGAMFIATASPAGAASAKGCSGSGRSIGEEGLVIDRASAPGEGGTEKNPFKIETAGKIDYDYTVKKGALGNGKWTASILDPSGLGLLPDIKFSGNITAGTSNQGSGVEELKKHLQVGGIPIPAGTFEIKIVARAPGVSCTVQGWLEINNSPVKSVIFIESMVLFLLGLLILFWCMATGSKELVDVGIGLMEEATGDKGDKP